jgi:superfamily II DNA or RNA helicase
VTTSIFAPGTLVRARGREWIVLPESEEDFLVLRPLAGSDDEIAGILPSVERVEEATFGLPDPSRPGDHFSARLMRDALRLGFRSAAGPFRCFGAIAVEPRPYQLVPLLMALRHETVRLLIADDVGIGKTVEASLIARELLDSGVANRLAVLCPPHLAEQWQEELSSKFHIDATLVLASTAGRLERECGLNQTLFELHPYVIVSTDFIKADKRRLDFIRTCPELVIVDEAHTCVADEGAPQARHQRYELLKGLARDKQRHLLLVTATPHSGKEGAFRALLALLDESLENLPEDLTGARHEPDRRQLARFMVQRRRGDIRRYLDSDTFFPEREEREESYLLTAEQKALFQKVLAFARETIHDPKLGRQQQRVRYWSALALLRSLASSPAAAEDTLRKRASTAETSTPEEADEIGRRMVLDQGVDEDAEAIDVTAGSDFEAPRTPTSRRLRALASEAAALSGDRDAKLVAAARLIRELVNEGFNPIVFVRFIPTAEYVAQELRKRLPKDVVVDAVTGELAPEDRKARVKELAQAKRHVLVATDCLSEGINLQDDFDAVFHYDLSWNPTRHEQREGRVDRYGQPRPKVRTLTFYGRDNAIDGVVLDVLLRKHRAIRASTGVSVPIPADAEAVVEAVLEGLLLRRDSHDGLEQLAMFESELRPRQEKLFGEWEQAADREKRSRTIFAQESIRVDEVAREVRDVRAAIGRSEDVARFVGAAVPACGGTTQGENPVHINLEHAAGVRDRLPEVKLDARFEMPVKPPIILLERTHPFVTALAAYVMESTLDPVTQAAGSRAGVIRTAAVRTRTTVLLLRLRFQLALTVRGRDRVMIAEESALLAFEGAAATPAWLEPDAAEALLDARPSANTAREEAVHFLRSVHEGFDGVRPHLDDYARARATALLDAHRRVRQQAGAATSARDSVVAKLPPDVLGMYVLLPAAGS